MCDRVMRIFCVLLLALSPSIAGDLQQLIDRAKPGDTIEVPPGVHHGLVRIDKPLSLVGHGKATIDGDGHGDVLAIAAVDVLISGLTIQGSGDSLDKESTAIRVLAGHARIENNIIRDCLFGIDLKVAPACIIRGNHIASKQLDLARQGDPIRLWRSDDCVIEDNVIEHGRDALLWYSDRVIVRRNVSRHNRYGFHMMFANDVTLEDNELTDNSVGVYLMYGHKFKLSGNRIQRNRGPSGYGIGLKEIDAYSVADNLISGNRVGIYIDGAPYTRRVGGAEIRNNTLACNDIGMSLLPAVRGNRIWDNNFIDNVEQVAILGRGAISGNEFAVDGRGNFWSDYAGYDRNRDGVGDLTYRSAKLFESLIDREPKLRLFLFSPAHDAIEFIGRAMPAVRPEPKFQDISPLMRPIELARRNVASNDGRMGSIALLLLGVALVVWIGGKT